MRAVSRFVNIDGEPIVDETPASYEWTVFPLPDPPAFDTRITHHPPAQNAGGPDALYEFRFEAIGPTPNMALFECSLDDEPFEECELPDDLRGPAGRPARLPGARGRPGRAARRLAGRRSSSSSRTRPRRRC